jgi:hypothetical protein
LYCVPWCDSGTYEAAAHLGRHRLAKRRDLELVVARAARSALLGRERRQRLVAVDLLAEHVRERAERPLRARRVLGAEDGHRLGDLEQALRGGLERSAPCR